MVDKIKKILDVLIDIRYKYSQNNFEEIYGDSVRYSDLEQESYIELKDMTCEKLNRKIKFRKHERNGMVLTVRAEMSEVEYESFIELEKRDTFNFSCKFAVSGVKLLKI